MSQRRWVLPLFLVAVLAVVAVLVAASLLRSIPVTGGLTITAAPSGSAAPGSAAPSGSAPPSASPSPVALIPWKELDTRWGTYLSEREWGAPRQAVGGDGWGMSMLDAVRTDYRWAEDGIAGWTTRDGAFAMGWALWDGKQPIVTERLLGMGNSGGQGEGIIDHRTFLENTPTTSYSRQVLAYPNQTSQFEVTFEAGRVDSRSGVLRATARNTAAEAGTLDLLLKGWFHDPTRRVEVTADGLLLHGATSVVAIVGGTPTSAQVSDRKRAIDRNLRTNGALAGTGPGHIGALDYRLDLAANGSASVAFAWAEDADPGVAGARARAIFGGAGQVLADRAEEAGTVFDGQVAEHEDVYRQALMGLLWNQSYYAWDGTSTYDPRWNGTVDAHDVLIMPDKWEFNWLATWDTGFQAVAAALIDPQLGADQLRFILSSRWQQADGHLPCAEWVMGVECPPVFAWAALRVADAGAGDAFLREVYPGLQALYDYWWKTNALEPRGLFTGGFLGMDNLPRAKDQAQADASAWMAFFARDLATIARRLGDEGAASTYDADRTTIAAAVNRYLWDDTKSFYFDRNADGTTLIPTVSYTGAIPLVAGIVPADRVSRVLAVIGDPAQLLSAHGVRSVSARSVIYEPGWSSRAGTNSNWRGPVWVPINYLLVEAIMPLDAALAGTIRDRVVATVEADWMTTGRFHEYYHAETGEGLGADAQTGWTALVANLIADAWPAK